MKKRFAIHLLLASAPLMAQNVYMNYARGYNFNNTFSQDNPYNIHADKLPIPQAHVLINGTNADFDFSTIFDNLSNNPDKKYKYTTSNGKNLNATMPGWDFLITDYFDRQITISWQYDTHIQHFDDAIKADAKLVCTDINGKVHEFEIGSTNRRNQIRMQRRRDKLNIYAGKTNLENGGTINIPSDFAIAKISLIPHAGANINIHTFNFETIGVDFDNIPRLSLAEINNHISKSDSWIAGYWAMAGYSTDDKKILTGGEYILALLPLENGEIVLYYIEGARINANIWQRGMEKCKLIPRADGVYTAYWRLSNGHMADANITAIFNGNNLQITFPFNAGASIILRPHNQYKQQ